MSPPRDEQSRLCLLTRASLIRTDTFDRLIARSLPSSVRPKAVAAKSAMCAPNCAGELLPLSSPVATAPAVGPRGVRGTSASPGSRCIFVSLQRDTACAEAAWFAVIPPSARHARQRPGDGVDALHVQHLPRRHASAAGYYTAGVLVAAAVCIAVFGRNMDTSEAGVTVSIDEVKTRSCSPFSRCS